MAFKVAVITLLLLQFYFYICASMKLEVDLVFPITRLVFI